MMHVMTWWSTRVLLGTLHVIVVLNVLSQERVHDCGLGTRVMFRNVSRDDGVEYTCVASNRFGTQSLTVYLQVFGE